MPSERPREGCYWLTYDGRRIGTVCLGLRRRARSDMYLGSFYLFPDERARGLARAALRAFLFAAATQGLGLRLTTQWTWGPAVRFWLRQGFWVLHWKRSLCLTRSLDTSAPVFATTGRTATLSVVQGGNPVVLMRAWSRAGRLCWRPCVPLSGLAPRIRCGRWPTPYRVPSRCFSQWPAGRSCGPPRRRRPWRWRMVARRKGSPGRSRSTRRRIAHRAGAWRRRDPAWASGLSVHRRDADERALRVAQRRERAAEDAARVEVEGAVDPDGRVDGCVSVADRGLTAVGG